MPVEPTGAIKVFYSYAQTQADRSLRDELDKHLANMQRLHQITAWYDRDIRAGEEWEREIDLHLNTAQIILLLISPDFMASDYCYSTEMMRALQRHETGEARVIPIILRPVDWDGAPFSKLKVLPAEGKPITTWPNIDEAFRHVTQGIRQVVQDFLSQAAEQWLSEGRLHHANKRYSQALAAYEKALNFAPTHVRAQRNKGDALYDLKRYSEALTAYEQAALLESSSARIHKSRADTLYQLKRYSEALTAYQSAIQLDPSLSHIYNDKGNVLYNLKRFDEALLAYEQAAQLDPTFAYAHNNKGNALSRLSRYQEALVAFDQAIRLQPNLALAYNNKGRALFHLQRYSESLTAHEQALRLNPNLIAAYSNKADTLEKLGRLQEAEQTRAKGRQLAALQ